MAILKKILFPGMQEAAQIAVTQLEKKADAANAINALTLTSKNTGVDANGHPVYTIGLAIDGKTIVKDENDALKSGLQLVYHEAGKVGDAQESAHIALTDNEGKELSVIPVSNIVGNGVLKTSAYDAATGILTLTFAQADGTEKPVEVDLKAMLDINDMSIAEGSKNYLEVTLGTAGVEGETQAVFGAKMVKVAEATDATTGLVDAKDVKDYVDKAATDLAVKAKGDEYITAGVDAVDNKQINVTADVQELTATVGTIGVYDAEGAQTTAPAHGSLSGVEKSLVDGANVAAKVKEYVDGEIAIEVARADAKVLAAVKALDATVKDGLTPDDHVAEGKHVGVKVVETDGVLTSISVVENDIASKAALDAEIDARKAADKTLTDNLAAEVTRAKAAETAIDAVVGLTKAAEGETRTFTPTTNYGGASATVMANMEAIDTKLKEVETKVAGVQYKVNGTTLEFFGITEKKA